MQQISRRRFIQGTAASAAGLWLASKGPKDWVLASTLSTDPGPFAYGVASGDPLADRVIIWTHVTAPSGDAVDVNWSVATSSDFGPGSVVRSGVTQADPSRDHTVKVDVDGLDPATTYWYRFEALGEQSRPGRTKTAPSEMASSLVFAVASCQNLPAGYYAAWRYIAARDLDFVLHVGDYIYEYGSSSGGLRPHVPSHEILDVTDYRLRYRNYRSDPDLRDAHAAHPFITAWDDHEVANNSWREGAQNHQPDEGSYLERRNAAYRVYDEWMPIRLPEPVAPDGGMRIYRELSYGQLADVYMLDTRQYRDQEREGPLPVPGPQTSPDHDAPGRTLLGPTQKEWLKERLQVSKGRARWRIIGNQVMFAHFTYGIWPDELSASLQELIGVPRDGYPVNPDQWDGYQVERKELLTYLGEEGIGNNIFCTGDIHMSFVSEVYADEGKFRVEAPVAAEFVGPSITSTNFNEAVGAPPRTVSVALEQAIKLSNPHIRYCELDSNGYVVCRATPDEMVGEWYFLSDARDAQATESLATAWRVKDGDMTLDWVGGQPVAT